MPLDHSGRCRTDGPARRRTAPTIADVAALAGVSTSTVSKVINDRYGVSRVTGQRVQEAVALLRFTPSLAATSLRGGSTRVLGLFAADLGPWESEVLRGATRAAGAARYGLLAWVGTGVVQSASPMIEGAIVVADAAPVGLTERPLVVVSPDGSVAPEDLGVQAVRRLLSTLSGVRARTPRR